jgi:leucyl/phenylalanyl-tRNA--protein transferase
VKSLSDTFKPPFPPVEPPPDPVVFPDPRTLGANDVVAVTRSLSPSLVLSAYRRGIFPWPVSHRVVPWVSPDPRAIFPLDTPPRWSRSLRKTLRRDKLTVTIDRAFDAVVRACGQARADGTWITADVRSTYSKLHELGWAHSVETWSASGELVGGLYGVAIGGTFAGESMFHRVTDASKVAFAALVERLAARGFALLDAQVLTDHLASLGCVAIPRTRFLDLLADAVRVPVRFADG